MEDQIREAAIAVSSVIARGALKKIGSNVADSILDKISNFLAILKKQSPQTVGALEKASEQTFDYDKVVLEVESAAKVNSEVTQSMQELVAAVRANPESIYLPNITKLADKIGQVVMPGATVSGVTITFE